MSDICIRRTFLIVEAISEMHLAVFSQQKVRAPVLQSSRIKHRARRKTCIKFEELTKSQRERIINRTDDTRRFYPHFLCNLKCRRTLLKEKKIL